MPLLRECSAPLALALQGGIELSKADIFIFTLQDGMQYYWTSWATDISYGGIVYSSKAPWLSRSKWSLSNTMEVPELTVYIRALNDSFDGGDNIKLQIVNGLFDGATFTLVRLFAPAATNNWNTLGGIVIFGGVTASAKVVGNKATITCKGKNNLLAQYAPRFVYQITCLHAFCDPGCTLHRADFTADYEVGTGEVSTTFIPWSGSAPPNAALYRFGTVTFTSGAASGTARTVIAADATGLTLVYPLYELPAPGDTFTAFQGCDKTKDSGSGQSCTDYDNLDNFLAFPFLPPPNSAY
jgi:uncharacterized phage protein (TIGR02218 family)